MDGTNYSQLTNASFNGSLNCSDESLVFTSTEKDKSRIPVWIVSITLTVIAGYLVISQLTFCIIKRKARDGYNKAFNVLCACASVVTFLRVGVPHHNKQTACGILHDIEAISYFLAYFLIWSTLWLRQFFFYKA